ncbi:DUF4189 domain-containing protein [Nocardia sp. NPDC058658]|uniref:DUF4189 domain-containing protein n=1 Tax=Nocardia sp. NPDC058658 TaxID=3346580 RepID=UPI003646D25C
MRFMGKAGFAVAASALAAGSVLGAGAANAQSLYGAIAYSPSHMTFESSFDWPSVEAAGDRAVVRCVYDDCEVLFTWSNGCAAVVTNTQGYTGVASGPNRAEAVRNAIAKVSELAPMALLANVGSSELSGNKVVDVICTSNAG